MTLPCNAALESERGELADDSGRLNEVSAWVFAGGEFCLAHLPAIGPEKGDRIVCVDRGLEHCLVAGFEPTVLIGDFDSVDQHLLNGPHLAHVPRHDYPAAKAASDLELALQLLVEEGIREVVILGVSGGRTDHMLFNWSLPSLRQWPFRLRLVDGTTLCHVLQGRDVCHVTAAKGQTLSLLAQTRVTGVSTSGLAYPLDKATLEVGSTLGLSNLIEDEAVTVHCVSGTLLVMLNREQARRETGAQSPPVG